jgi:MATE family multidrug resistance protein
VFAYNLLIIIIFNLYPDTLISIFNSGKDKENFSLIMAYTIPLIHITSIWSIFDSIQIIIGSVLRTMGDTIFLLIILSVLPAIIVIIPIFIFVVLLSKTLVWVWFVFVIYVVLLSIIMSFRFKQGKWKNINVIK